MRALQPVSLVGVGSSPWLVLDQFPDVASVRLDLVAGGLTVQVDYTDDDPFQNPGSSAITVGGQAIASGSANVTTALTSVPRAVRLTCTVGSGGPAILKVVQQGIR